MNELFLDFLPMSLTYGETGKAFFEMACLCEGDSRDDDETTAAKIRRLFLDRPVGLPFFLFKQGRGTDDVEAGHFTCFKESGNLL